MGCVVLLITDVTKLSVEAGMRDDRVIITSFLDEALAAVGVIARDIRTGLLVCAPTLPGYNVRVERRPGANREGGR